MSEPKCPGCGAAARQRCDESEPTEDRLFWCGRLERVIKGRMWDVIESETCFRRQLAQRDERNAALEARNKELEEENAELLSKLEQIIAPVEVGGGIEAVLRTMVKELEAELARPKHEVLRQLADAIERIKELEARALRMERALRTIEAWPFNIMGDCVADARALARKALEEADDAVR